MRLAAALTLILLGAGVAGAQTWEPVTDPEEIEKLFSDTVLTTELKDGVMATATYRSDGTGELRAWGDTFPRLWKLDEQGRACILISGSFRCFEIEKNAEAEKEYRGTNVETGETVVFSVDAQAIRATREVEPGAGSAGEPSADELAAKLSNPTAPVMTIGNNLDFIAFDGDLPGADDETAVRYVFQTAFPYKLANGGSIFFRPALPILFNDPVPDGQGGFSSKGTDLGDMGFDFSYGKTTDSGLLYGAGMVGTVPTATDDSLGKDKWGLGPELLFGVLRKWGIVGGLLTHQWDVGGSGDAEIDVTSLNYFYAFSLGGGWQFASGPTISYDHTRASGDRWTVPLGVGIARTMVLGGRPWKFQLQYWNYVEAADALAAEHQVRFSFSPVVSVPWNEGR
jgi:hypothetical protein